MRTSRLILLAGVTLQAHPGIAAEALKFGPAPAWVIPQIIPQAPASASGRPVAILLHDQQTAMKPGTISTFSELAFKIQNPEGLAAGNLAVAWNPATDTVTVNKLEIHRGAQVIDVLAAGQKFTTMRRETSLEAAMLDGVLTASIQPEGLQEGDVVVLATTDDHSDPVLKTHVEAVFAPWSSAQIGLAHARLLWPKGLDVKVQASGPLVTPKRDAEGGLSTYELTMKGVEPVIAPNSAPVRFGIGRMGEATDFRSWADAARLMMPLYTTASVIPASGPLRLELEKIRNASPDPKKRAELALQLVQERIRYVALLMGQGGLVPASAATTWERRFGDCKAKTALLLGLLHELGISAEPILANVAIGDALGERLPMIGLFNHVFVKARIGNKDYWLDGTRIADKALDSIEVPDFGWVLPLTENAQLIHLRPAALATPGLERRVEVDASAGAFAPATIGITETYRDDSAVTYNAAYSQLSADQRDELMRNEAKTYFDGFNVSSSSLKFDEPGRILTLTIKGSAKLNWDDGWLSVPISSIAFNPDFERPAGPGHEAPIKVNYPRFVKDLATVRLPAALARQQKLHTPVRETLAGVEYARTETVSGDSVTVESSERSITQEIPYKEAVAAAPRLRALDKDDVYLRLDPVAYHPSDKDWAPLAQLELSSADQYVDRGLMYTNGRRFPEAIADFGQALRLEPDNKWALADRALAQVSLRHFDEADKDLAALDAHNPDMAIALRAHALIAESKEDCAKAVDFYTRSLAKEPGNNFAIGHRAMCESSLSRIDEALADSATALKADPTWMDLRLLRANLFVRRGNKDLVAKEAELLTTENPRSAFAYVAAGKIYAQLTRAKEAMKAFDSALAIEPAAYVYVNRAQARPFTDKAGRLADLDAALKLEPDNFDALAEKAEQLAADGDLKGARQLYDRVVAAAGDERHYKIRRAVLMFKTGSTDEARKLFAAFRIEAKSASDFNSLCWAKATAGILLDLALDECHEALKREPDDGSYLDSVALVELRLGRVDQAIADYTQAIAKKGGAASYMGRALAYARKGNAELSASDLKHALQLDPNEQTRFAEFGLHFDQSRGGPAAAKNGSTN